MAKDPAFLFYDGDAARDVSHMNRLERGCYFDLIQAQRKFGGYTTEQARKILGKDFDSCWESLELVLTKEEGGIYYIEWVRLSIAKRTEHAELQRKRIQDYWDKKKEVKEKVNIPKQFHGITTVIPLENENENINSNKEYNSNKVEIAKQEEEKTPLQKWISEKLKNVSKMEQQITREESEKLLKNYSKELIEEKLEAMDNTKGITKKYVSVYKTCNNWCRMKLEKNGFAPTGSSVSKKELIGVEL